MSVHQSRVSSDTLELESQRMWAAVWVLAIEPRSCRRVTSSLNRWPAFQPRLWFLKGCIEFNSWLFSEVQWGLRYFSMQGELSKEQAFQTLLVNSLWEQALFFLISKITFTWESQDLSMYVPLWFKCRRVYFWIRFVVVGFTDLNAKKFFLKSLRDLSLILYPKMRILIFRCIIVNYGVSVENAEEMLACLPSVRAAGGTDA